MKRGRADDGRASLARFVSLGFVGFRGDEHREGPKPKLQVWTPDEAVAHAHALPPPAEFVVDGVTPEEWDAFYAALAEM